MSSNIPKNIYVNKDGDTSVLTYRWFNIYVAKFIGLTVICDVILFVFTAMLFNKAGNNLLPFIFPVAIILMLNYVTLVFSINKTDIKIKLSILEVRHYPLRWFGFANEREDLRKYLSAVVDTGPGSIMMPNNSANVYVVQKDGKRKRLVRNLRRVDQAQYIAEYINSKIFAR